jgi:hypothetical protein
MSETAMPGWDERLRKIASSAVYPATPDLWPVVRHELSKRAGRRPAPRLGWAAALGAVALAVGLSLFAIPSARAALYRVIQLGVVRIFAEPATATPVWTAVPAGTPSPTAAPELRAPLDLLGATSLESVREALGDAFRLPTYPPDLGDPDLAYLQSPDGPVGVLVWLDPDDPAKAGLALTVLGSWAFGGKSDMRLILETEVGGRPALWLVGPHALLLRSGETAYRTLVSGNVLLWQVGETTYRLETAEALEEAVRIAESLR